VKGEFPSFYPIREGLKKRESQKEAVCPEEKKREES